MTATFITGTLTGTGARFTYGANGDQLVVLGGATYGSTDSSAILSGGFSDLVLTILGTVFAASGTQFSGDNATITIGSTGVFYCSQPNYGNSGLFLASVGCALSNSGTISAPAAIAVLSEGGSTIRNFGLIEAASGVFMNLFSTSGDSLVNAGTIAANMASDATNDERYNNAVFAEGSNARIINLEGGLISAISSDGAGVRLSSVAGGSVVRNFGEIDSARDCGVNLELVSAGQALIRVVNAGTISGDEAAYNGSLNADALINRGALIGDVTMGLGDDTLSNIGGEITGQVLTSDGADVVINRDGRIIGDVDLGAGVDSYDGRSGSVTGTVTGGDGNDAFIGNALESDVFDGGAGADLLDFRFGPAVTIALDGSFANDGAALGDRFSHFERVFGSDRADEIRGDAAGNILNGNGGADRLDGAEGGDVLVGGAGRDTLTGGLGNDSFRFLSLGDCRDVITDFHNVAGDNDRFQIDASAFGGGLVTGALAAADFRARADNLAQDASDRFIFRTTDATLWFDADGAGAGAAVLVADLQAGATMTAADIVLI